MFRQALTLNSHFIAREDMLILLFSPSVAHYTNTIKISHYPAIKIYTIPYFIRKEKNESDLLEACLCLQHSVTFFRHSRHANCCFTVCISLL